MKQVLTFSLMALLSIQAIAQTSETTITLNPFKKRDRKGKADKEMPYVDEAPTNSRTDYFIGHILTKGDTAKIAEFLATGIELNAPAGNDGFPTILILAVQQNSASTVDYILKRGADPNLRMRYTRHQMFSDNISYAFSEYPLETAARNADIEKMDILIKYGADINRCLESLKKIAADKGDMKLIRFINQKAGASAVDKNAIAVMTEYDHLRDVYKVNIQMVEELISGGADVNAYSPNGKTALINVISGRDIRDRVGLAKTLLKHGADPNQTDRVAGSYQGNMKFYPTTPLRYAAQMGYLDLVKLLIENGARDLNGALADARTDEIKEYLILKGAK